LKKKRRKNTLTGYCKNLEKKWDPAAEGTKVLPIRGYEPDIQDGHLNEGGDGLCHSD